MDRLRAIYKSKNLGSILCASIVFTIVFGDAIKLNGFRIAGLIPTLYRVVIPIIFISIMFFLFSNKSLKRFFSLKLLNIFLAMMLFWIVYGTVLLLVSDFVDLHDGIKELLDLTLGMFSVVCLYCVTKNEHILEVLMKTLKIIVIFLCLYGLFEAFTGIHFATSKYFSGNSLSLLKTNILTYKLFPITTVFYGINDFSVFIATFSPLFVFDKTQKNSTKIIDSIMIITIMLLLFINDANICFVATIAGFMLMLFFKRKKKGLGLIGINCFIQILGGKVVYKMLINLKYFLKYFTQSPQNDNGLIPDSGNDASGFTEVLELQINNASDGGGSLYNRLMIYKDAIHMALDTRLLGVGPAGFSNYLEKKGGSTYLRDPHNWWLEILSQYGIFVLVFYLVSIICIFIENIKVYNKSQDFKVLQTLMICVVFVIACVAPSTFLGYNYQWIIPTLGLINIKIHSNYEQSRENQ